MYLVTAAAITAYMKEVSRVAAEGEQEEQQFLLSFLSLYKASLIYRDSPDLYTNLCMRVIYM